MIIQPPDIKQGDTIGIMCPAGFMPAEKTNACVAMLQNWGYKVAVGKTVGGLSQNYFSGTDEDRLRELQEMLDDKKIKAILFARGGYGTGRIIDQINFKKFLKHPKWLIGFSDITIFHTHLLSNYKMASLHAPMAAAFQDISENDEYILSLKDTLEGRKTIYNTAPHPYNKTGECKGVLIGGNLALLANMIGTDSDFKTNNRILFIEDIGEYLYNADRMLTQLKRSGKFSKLKGLIFGGFTDMKDTERKFGTGIEEILKSYADELDCPVCFRFPVSHGKENFALKVGGKYHLTVEKENVQLMEL